MNEDSEILNERLRGLAAATEQKTSVSQPDAIRARGTRRRNRIRVGGAATMAACVIAVSAWVAVPGGDEPAGQTGAAASSGMPSPPVVSEAMQAEMKRALDDANRNPEPPVLPEGPSMGPIDFSFLPEVPGVIWNTDAPWPNRLMNDLRWYGPCSPELLMPGLASITGHWETKAGSRLTVLTSSTYGSARTPAQNELDAVQLMVAWSARAQTCMTPVPGGGADDSAAWSWQTADGKRGRLVIARRGHNVALVATDMVASDPDYVLAPTLGSEVLDHANLKD
jgi:hypothetical protein